MKGMRLRRLATLFGLLLFPVQAQGIPEWFPITFSAELSGRRVVPAVDTDAVATVTAVLTGRQLVVTGSYQDVGVTANSGLVGAAIRQAERGETGPIVALEALPGSHMSGEYMYAATSNLTSGTLSAVFRLTEDQTQALKSDLWYVEFYNRDEANAVIRGQLSSKLDYSALELAPAAGVPTAAEMAGIWKREGERVDWQFVFWQLYDDGSFTTLLDVSEAGKSPLPGRDWSYRDGILSWTNGRNHETGQCGGQYAHYVERLPEGRIRLFALQARESCYGEDGGWTTFVRVEP